MTWFKVDDGLSQHRKVLSIPRAHRKAAMGLWVLAGSWSAAGLTDGHVPEYMIDELACASEDAKWLVYAGLWEDDPAGNGWWFHEWTERQPTRQQVEERRVVRAVAGRQGGIKSGQSRRSSASSEAKPKQVASPDEASASGVASTRSNPRPVPSRPKTQTPAASEPIDQEELDLGASADAPAGRMTLDQHFARFWNSYPRRKEPRAARLAWDKARKRATVEVIQAGCERYAAEMTGKDTGYMKHPATWLNADCWGDEPDAKPTDAYGHQGWSGYAQEANA